MSQNMTIRTNMTSLTAHRNIKNTGLQQRRAANRLASGFRINSAADDAAGLAISENMRAQIRGLNQAIRNAQDGISLIQTAEGGLASINDIIIRMREIVVQASNDTYTLMQRTMLQAEIDQLINEIDSLSHRVEFNGKRLLARALTGVNSHSAIAPPILMSAQTATIQPLSIPPIPDITLNINTLADGESGTGWNFADGVLNITGGGIFQIDGTGASTTNRITVASGVDADVILNNVLINTDTGAALDMREANVNLWLAANSTNIMSTTHEHSAGIQTTGGTLVLDGTGSVVATGGSGVGSGSGSGAGIGGGTDADGGVIVINGGNITAHGGAGLPGVGG
ncbi:MAG: hypothetical protein FWF80_01645, partial [Defluviitaleaceae bacterium]|nr:hypothetical protein [Defluviitaleaceae bacterium]